MNMGEITQWRAAQLVHFTMYGKGYQMKSVIYVGCGSLHLIEERCRKQFSRETWWEESSWDVGKCLDIRLVLSRRIVTACAGLRKDLTNTVDAEAIFTFKVKWRWREWLRHRVTSQKVAVSIPDGVSGIFHWYSPSNSTMVLGSTQPVTETNARDIFWG
jgi:hypothetical protein